MATVQVLQQRQTLHTVHENAARLQSSSALQPLPRYPDTPTIMHANEQKALKSEDVIYVRRVEAGHGDCHSIFMVCDGHQGAGAANHCVEHMPGLLGQLLPAHLPDWHDLGDVQRYAEKVRRAISTAAVLLDNDWTRMDGTSGTTLTIAVVSGWLLTVANTGDSNAVIDTGDEVQEITYSHRIQVNKGEQNRLRQSSVQLAPLGFHLQGPAKPQEMGVGPLRMWPGGLCVSRSIGDLDAGPLIVPLPHVRQVLLTRQRALRLIMASDGLWDLVTFSKAAKSVRHKLPHQAVNTLVQMVAKDRRMADDVSIIIVDVLPPPSVDAQPPNFPASALQAGHGGLSSANSCGSSNGSSNSSSKSARSGSGGLFSCFKGPQVVEPEPVQAPAGPPPAGSAATIGRSWTGLQYLADVDCYQAYPVHGASLARSSVATRPASTVTQVKGDFTVHGGQHAHKFQHDASWHTGDSQHGANSFPRLLSQAQLEQLQADGPAAAAGMTLGSLQQQQAAADAAAAAAGSSIRRPGDLEDLEGRRRGGRKTSMEIADPDTVRVLMGSDSGGFSNAAAAAAGGDAGPTSSSSSSSCQQPAGYGIRAAPSQQLPTAAYNNASGAAAAAAAAGGGKLSSSSRRAAENAGGGGGFRPMAALSALIRSASAEFETESSSGVYVAASETEDGRPVAPGKVVGMSLTAAGGRDIPHYGSAPVVPMALATSYATASSASSAAPVVLKGGAVSLTAAAEAEEEQLYRLGVRSALCDNNSHNSNRFGEGI